MRVVLGGMRLDRQKIWYRGPERSLPPRLQRDEQRMGGPRKTVVGWLRQNAAALTYR